MYLIEKISFLLDALCFQLLQDQQNIFQLSGPDLPFRKYMNWRDTHCIPILWVGFQNSDDPYAYAQGRGRILTRDQPAVGDAIWLPGFAETEVTPMAPQGCFQFERHISFGIILFFVIAEGSDILTLDQPGAISQSDIQQRYRAVTNGADHFAAFPHGLDGVVNEFIFGHVDHRSQSAGYENGIISVDGADLGDR